MRETVHAKNKQTILDQKEGLHISNRTNMKLMIYSKQFVASSINILGCVVIPISVTTKQAACRTGLAISLETGLRVQLYCET